MKALYKLYGTLGLIGEADVFSDYFNGYLSEHTARNGRPVLWYMDERNNEAIYTDTLEFLTDDEIEQELA